VSGRRREMYIGHTRLFVTMYEYTVCLSLAACPNGPGCNLGEW